MGLTIRRSAPLVGLWRLRENGIGVFFFSFTAISSFLPNLVRHLPARGEGLWVARLDRDVPLSHLWLARSKLTIDFFFSKFPMSGE